jgi:hypothetical protein
MLLQHHLPQQHLCHQQLPQQPQQTRTAMMMRTGASAALLHTACLAVHQSQNGQLANSSSQMVLLVLLLLLLLLAQ